MDIIWAILIGAVCGYVGGLLMKMNGSWLRNIIVGILGGALGGWLFGLIGLSLPGFVGALIGGIVGSCVILAIVKAIFKK